MLVIASLALTASGLTTFAPLHAVADLIALAIRVLYTLAPVVAIGSWIARRLHSRRTGAMDAWLSAWALGWSTLTLLGLALLAFGGWHPMVWVLTAMLANLALLWCALRARGTLRRSSAMLLERARSGGALRTWIAGLTLIGALGACTALVPPNQRDELTYHLLLPRLWDEQHDWWMHTDNDHLFFPADGEIVWGYATVVGGRALPRIVVLVFSLSTLLLMWEHARGDGCSKAVAAATVGFFAVTPAALHVFAAVYVEWPLVFFALMAWREIRRWLAQREPVAAVLAAVSLGALAGLKTSALALAIVLALEWIVRASRLSLRKAIVAMCFSVGGIAALAGPWMFRNAIALGDPIHPLGAAVFGSATPDSTRDLVEFSQPPGWYAAYPLLFHAIAEPTVDHRLHLGWVLWVPLVMAVGWRRRSELPWFAVMSYSLALLPFAPAPRIYLPVFALYWLFLPKPVARLCKAHRTRIGLTAAASTLAITALPSALLPSLALAIRAAEGRFLAGGDYDSFLRTQGFRSPVMDYVRGRWPQDARVWVWCDDEVLYFDRWVRPDGPFAAPSFLRILRNQGTAGLDRVLREDRIDLVAVQHQRCPLQLATVRSRSRSFELTPQERGLMHQWLERRLQPTVMDDRYALYTLIPGPETGLGSSLQQ